MTSTRLQDCVGILQEAYVLGKAEYESKNPGYRVILTCTHRSTDEQKALYARGRTTPGNIVTYVDGVTKLSQHNYIPARAFDFAIMFHGKIVWNSLDEFAEAASYFKRHGVLWGGDWSVFKDYPHIETREIL